MTLSCCYSGYYSSSSESLDVLHVSTEACFTLTMCILFGLVSLFSISLRYCRKYQITEATCAQHPRVLAPLLHQQYHPVIGFIPLVYSTHKLYVLFYVWRELVCALRTPSSSLCAIISYDPFSSTCSFVWDLACLSWYMPIVRTLILSSVNSG